MRIIEQQHAIHVIGIELRTTNEEAMETIPRHWQRFSQENVAAAVPACTGPDVYAVYTHFQDAGRGNAGLYSLVIGMAADPAAVPPPGMVRAVLPAGPRAVFPVERGRPDKVVDGWREVWGRTDLRKSFVADCECFAPDGRIEIRIGLHPAA